DLRSRAGSAGEAAGPADRPGGSAPVRPDPRRGGQGYRAAVVASDTVRYGLVGTGMMGIEHLWNIQHLPDAEVTAIADPHEGSRDLAVLAAGEGRATFEHFTTATDLLASGLCDVVVV